MHSAPRRRPLHQSRCKSPHCRKDRKRLFTAHAAVRFVPRFCNTMGQSHINRLKLSRAHHCDDLARGLASSGCITGRQRFGAGDVHSVIVGGRDRSWVQNTIIWRCGNNCVTKLLFGHLLNQRRIVRCQLVAGDQPNITVFQFEQLRFCPALLTDSAPATCPNT